jgi:hypothetical protein
VTKFLVFSNAREGKDDEYNAWYDSVHLPDVLSLSGVKSGERYRVQQVGDELPEHRYLAVYDLDGDPGTVLKELRERSASGQFALSDSLDLSTVKMMFWEPI